MECEWTEGLRRQGLQRYLQGVGCRLLLPAGDKDAGRTTRLAV